jgi:hypothetical protein
MEQECDEVEAREDAALKKLLFAYVILDNGEKEIKGSASWLRTSPDYRDRHLLCAHCLCSCDYSDAFPHKH